MPKAFVIGGLICCTGQFFTDLYIMIGNDGDTASAYTSITLVLISALLTGFGQYERIAMHAGGSGCGCSASVLCGHILPQIAEGKLHRVLFAATGALMSTTKVQQGESIPGISHLVEISDAL